MNGLVAFWQQQAPRLPRYTYRGAATGLAVLIMERLAAIADLPLFLVPFVTSIALTISVPQSDAARPYAVIMGHVASTIIGLIVLWTLGTGDSNNALAVGVAVLAMLALRALHPPAALDAFVATSQTVAAGWLIMPILIGAILLAAYGRIVYWLERKILGDNPPDLDG